MASLRDIRSRINSVKSTRQITSAMKMVSAAKLKKAQNRITNIRPYVNEMKGIIDDLSEHFTEKITNVYTEQRELKNTLIVLITSNKGLCGAFNTNICKKAVSVAEEKFNQDFNYIKFYCIGKKGHDFINKVGYEVLEYNDSIFDDLSYENISNLAAELMKLFEKEEFDRVEIVYNSFKVASLSSQSSETFLPLEIKEEKPEFPTEYIFEPDLLQIKENIIPDYLKTKLFSIFLDSVAAEHGARMTAMHQATDNASELIKELTLEYNKARQAAITKEILEITSGAEALKG